MSLVAEILSAPHTFAIVGVSQDPARYGHEVFDAFVANGQRVFPINPKYQSIDGHSCYPSLDTLPETPDVAVTAVPPAVTEKVAEMCTQLGIPTLWMTPGAESEAAIAFCAANGVQVIHGLCPVFVLKLPQERWLELP
jgi:uncharacterized protein